MCILFIAIDNNPRADGYQLIVANNRDEFYTRPTKPAGRWTDHKHCISGLDQFPGREGGTWFGMSEDGKLGSLLNILTHELAANKKGRGSLVTDYLSGSQSASDYTAPLARDRKDYNPFNLVLMEKRSKKWSVHYFGSDDDESPFDMKQDDKGIYTFGNSVLSSPWKKVTDGKPVFSKIVDNYPTVKDKPRLIEKILDMLNDPSPHLPDPQLASQAEPIPDFAYVTERSGIYVEILPKEYGTRTNTLILVDSEGRGEYIERTMREPVNPQEPVWDTNTINFTLQPSI